MQKKQIKEEIMKHNEGRPFISLTEICRAMHVGPNAASAMVKGLEYIPNGKRKDYLVDDLAERLCERKMY